VLAFQFSAFFTRLAVVNLKGFPDSFLLVEDLQLAEVEEYVSGFIQGPRT